MSTPGVANHAPAVSRAALIVGTTWALAAGLMWGLAFVAPLLLTGYHPLEITAGRYTAYGVISIVALLAAHTQGPIVGLGERRIWGVAFALTLVGNFIYFTLLAAGIPLTGAPMAALIVGTLPVLIPIAASWRNRSVRLTGFVVPGVLMVLGLIAVHLGERHETTATSGFYVARIPAPYLTGLALVFVALLAWTIYGVANARAVAARPDIAASTWASLQGVTLLPVAVPLLTFGVMTGATQGVRPGLGMFIAVSLALGVLTSWVATWCWNRAAQLLPAQIAGQLIVFETLAGLFFAYLWKFMLPPALVTLGASLLIGGVLLGVARLRQTPKW
jgi:drug/metabolite transporter (DMT)-like permease